MRKSIDGLRIKRIYEPPEDADGARVLVDRVWPRGIAKEHARLDLWLKDIAPSAALRKWFNHDPARWQEFRRRYRADLDDNETRVSELLHLISKHSVTLLYGARDTTHNQAIVLLEYLKERAAKRVSF
jgi:uncharacterized protein YeaO (DUF488 family)